MEFLTKYKFCHLSDHARILIYLKMKNLTPKPNILWIPDKKKCYNICKEGEEKFDEFS